MELCEVPPIKEDHPTSGRFKSYRLKESRITSACAQCFAWFLNIFDYFVLECIRYIFDMDIYGSFFTVVRRILLYTVILFLHVKNTHSFEKKLLPSATEVKSFCKVQFDVSSSVARALADAQLAVPRP